MTTVEVVGSGPAAESLVAAVGDADATVTRSEEPFEAAADLTVVVGPVTADTFQSANDRAIESGSAWVAVELGGIGGVPAVDAAVSGFGPRTGCYDCLRQRVRANVDQGQAPAEAPSTGTQRFAGAVAGRRIERALAGEGALAGTVVELPHTERRFLPVPGCRCDESSRWRLRRSGASEHEREALARAETGLDQRVGIVRDVGEGESFPAPYYLASLTDTSGFSDATAPQQAAGVAVDWDTAFMKALGEGYERYAAGTYREAAMARGTPESVEGALDPASFVAPDGEGWTADGERSWVPAETLDAGEGVAAPAEVVVYPPPSRTVRPATTTGLGLGSSETEALLSGLYEVIERDAAMLAWYSTYDPLEVVVEDSEAFDTLRRRARSEDLSVTALSLTQDVDVPVVTVAVRRDAWPRFALGTSASLDAESAAVGALEEALQNWMELRGMGREDARAEDGAIGRYADRPEDASSLVEAETAVPLSSIGLDAPPEGEAELEALVERATDAGLAPYATRLTTRDLEGMGFEAVRVFCPTAQPLFFDDAYFGERAERVPADLGFEPRLRRAHHPFP
ncbi:YcaO-like family protein [Haloarcula nitratireducens]|uniref:YcaO-like family protein n=1 Tax=Haloarcula nitratireducens TaxID=2487749 RepID=A0AAW4P989_9EURY|nr:YcaO-like family protein [Halomicroarcula nitratireducens]MBX0294368.1 YcaO-like family protein [Halomicroarcula nitratireducens]